MLGATMWNIIWVLVRNIPGIPHTELCLEAETAAYSQKPTSGAVISILAPRPCVAILHQLQLLQKRIGNTDRKCKMFNLEKELFFIL